MFYAASSPQSTHKSTGMILKSIHHHHNPKKPHRTILCTTKRFIDYNIEHRRRNETYDDNRNFLDQPSCGESLLDGAWNLHNFIVTGGRKQASGRRNCLGPIGRIITSGLAFPGLLLIDVSGYRRG
jgi:hypothetical protein